MMTFLTTCTAQRDATDLEAMCAASRQITRRTFLRHVDRESLRHLERCCGYGRGLSMAADAAVSYHKSVWKGKPCVYLDWSRIEHIFQ